MYISTEKVSLSIIAEVEGNVCSEVRTEKTIFAKDLEEFLAEKN